MISTVSSELKPEVNFLDAIRNAFPMGSMTGAPKIKAMELIEELEVTKRGVYSGAFGYINPDYNFDFNVVIRSILYNKEKRFLSFQAGSAITYDSVPEKEYEECLLKAESIKKLLEAGC
jgi:para-aminobenzoate synthetase component 1